MPKAESGPIRVVVVDDTSTVRELLVAILQQAEGIQVVGAGTNGEEAVRLVKRLRPDVVTMDVRMPRVDGLEATRRIMGESPTRIVIVTGSLMRAGEDLTFEALRAGALTVIRTPGVSDLETCDDVIRTVRLMSEVPVVHRWDQRVRKAEPRPARKPEPGLARTKMTPPPLPVARDDGRGVGIIGVASSTGGPGALATLLRPLAADFPVPILIVQHITPGFATGLAEWLNSETALRVGLAGHGDVPSPGTALIGPDDYHLQVNARGVVELSKEAAYKGLRPSANYLFRSLAWSYGSRAMGVILTGMGDDGVEGLADLHRAGGPTVAQDEASCVVYGMPREAVARQVVDRILTPEQIAASFQQLGLVRRRSRVGSGERGGR